jgi:predicted amidohydrolase YtcJ
MSTMILQNGLLYTTQDEFKRASLVVSGNRIEEVLAADIGLPSDVAEGADTVDLNGAYVLPGFVDTHIHLTALALNKLRCNLSTANSARDVCEQLSEWAAAHGEPVVVGVDFDESQWEHATLPTRVMLDGIDDKRPILVRRICGHLGVVNTPLLERLPKRPDLVDEEAGTVREHALWDAGRLWEPEPGHVVAAMDAAIQDLHGLGVTTIHDIVDPKHFDAYISGVSQSPRPLRIDALLHTNPRHLEHYKRKCEESGARDLRLAGLKCFLDGSLGARTAALNADYTDGYGWGNLLLRKEVVQALAEECSENGYVLAIHAIGDRAIDQALGVFRGFPQDSGLFRIEHCEVAGPAQIESLKTAPVFLSLQPNFVRNWGQPGGLNERRLGEDRNKWCNRFRSLIDTGVACVFGSDGMPPGPLFGMKGATEHPVSDERLTVPEALTAYTNRPHSLPAHARDAGTLDRGRLADLTVLDKDPLTEDLDTIRVLKTMVDGEIVFEAEPETTDLT